MNIVSAISSATKATPTQQRAIKALANAFDAAMAQAENPVIFRKQLGDQKLELHLSDLKPSTLNELGRLRDASEKVEALLMKQMLSVMQKSIPKSEFDGPMGDLGKDMLTDALSQDLTKSQKGGLADSMFKQFAEQILMGDIAASKGKGAAQQTQTSETKP